MIDSILNVLTMDTSIIAFIVANLVVLGLQQLKVQRLELSHDILVYMATVQAEKDMVTEELLRRIVSKIGEDGILEQGDGLVSTSPEQR